MYTVLTHSQKSEDISIRIPKWVQVVVPTFLQILQHGYEPTQQVRLCLWSLYIIWITTDQSILSIFESK